MTIKYTFGEDEFNYEVDWRDVKTELKRIMSDMDKKSLIDLLLEQDGIEDYFEWELEDAFEHDAREMYKESRFYD